MDASNESIAALLALIDAQQRVIDLFRQEQEVWTERSCEAGGAALQTIDNLIDANKRIDELEGKIEACEVGLELLIYMVYYRMECDCCNLFKFFTDRTKAVKFIEEINRVNYAALIKWGVIKEDEHILLAEFTRDEGMKWCA